MSACRLCHRPLYEFLDLGRQPLSDAFLRPDQYGNEYFYHLGVAVCESCDMVQLSEDVPNELMFHDSYPYHSSESSVMRQHFGSIAKRLLESELTGRDPFVVEIGSNDGVMLRAMADAGVRHLGVEPCGDLAKAATAHGVNVLSKHFDDATGREIASKLGAADVIFSANTFSHIDYLPLVLRGVDALLKPDGVFVFEDPYFVDVVELTSFDQFIDEHVYFFTAQSIQRLARAHGFELVDVERLAVHGGELRCTLARSSARTPSPSVATLLAEERRLDLGRREALDRFADRVNARRTTLTGLLRTLRQQGKSVVGYGATAKSATVLNYCEIGPDIVSEVYDSTPVKQGLRTPGMHIPVRSPTHFRNRYPDYALLLAWNHADEIMAKETEFGDVGGRWILYVPDVHVV